MSLFGEVYGDPAVDAAVADAAWLRAMLDAEAALARAGARTGTVPAAVAAEITSACALDSAFDVASLGRHAGTSGTPVIALVARLRELVGSDVAPFVHRGATSQDVLDTALVLVARRAVPIALAGARSAADSLAALAREHRDTPQVGRTLLQDGAVTTFGAACAVRTIALDDASSALERALGSLPAQLGGAVGTTSPEVTEAFAAELELPAPVVPWHTTRGPVAALVAALAVLAGELGAVAQDLVLLASSGIGEVTPGAPGGSSAMPHKQNPSRATLALACAHRVPGVAAGVLAGMPQELQRSAGRWQAEWGAVTEAIGLLGGAARHTAAALDGVVVHADRMSSHVDALVAQGVPGDPGAAAAWVDRAMGAR